MRPAGVTKDVEQDELKTVALNGLGAPDPGMVTTAKLVFDHECFRQIRRPFSRSLDKL
jgi:hypothetical protein